MIERNAILLLVVLASCAGYRPARFTDAPVVLDADDEREVPMPVRRPSSAAIFMAEAFTVVAGARSLEVSRPPLASDVNRLDEVVRSSWFHDQPGLDPLEGYDRDGPPQPPLLVIEEQPPIDVEPSTLIEDSRGLRYQLVFDLSFVDETRTAAMAITSRLFYALGYHAAETHVIETPAGKRAAAVRFPPGHDLGPTPLLWTRPDDPNDVLTHVDRRSLRATRVVAAWLGLTQFSEGMFRDVFIGSERRGFVRHMVVGFESSLGTAELVATRRDAFDPDIDSTPSGLLLVTLGMYPKPDELPPTSTGTKGIGLYTPDVIFEQFGVAPPFAAHQRMRPDDAYWIVKHMNALDNHTLERAVEAGRLSEARSRRYLLGALAARRRSLAQQIFALVTPCDVTAVRSLSGGSVRLELMDHEARVLDLHDAQHYSLVVTDLDGETLAEPRDLRARPEQLSVSLDGRLFVGRDVVVARLFKQSSGVERERSLDVHIVRDERGARLLGVEH